MGWLKDFIVGIKDSYKTDIKIIIALIIVFIIIIGFSELYNLVI